jgi:hypothetical protein
MASIPSGPKKKVVVDPITPRPGKGGGMVFPGPKKPKGSKGGGMMKPLPIDDKIYRTMPITEKQLGTIKKMYGIK